MIPSYPAHELPLDELLRFAAENRITAAIDLRSSITAGRIDIVHGEVVDAAFGGLICEEAVCAALNCKALQVLRGRTPPKSMTRRVRSTTEQILAAWRGQRDAPRPPPHQHGSCCSSNAPSTARNAFSKRSGLLRYLRFGTFVGASMALLGGGSYGVWSLSHPSQHALTSSTPAGRDPAEAAACGQAVREFAPQILQRTVGVRHGSCSLAAQALVEKSGLVSGVRVRSPNDCSPSQENAAIQSLLASKFEPAQCNGRFIASWAEVPIRFEDSSAVTLIQDGKLARR